MKTQYYNTPLIDEPTLKSNSPITFNTDIETFVPYIHIAQYLYIEPILGELLYSELITQVAEQNISTANQALLVQLAMPLSFWTVYQALPFHWAKIVNKGITIQDSENSNGIDRQDLGQLREWIRSDANTLNQKLTDYLTKCKENYPLFRTETECGSSNRSEYKTGFYFPKKINYNGR